MQKYKNKYRIPSARLESYNYSQNSAYFVTLCTKNKKHLFGKITNDRLDHTQTGKIANECWHGIPTHFVFVRLGKWIVMPNHIHGILFIEKENDTNEQTIENKFASQCDNLAAIMRGYKAGVTKRTKEELGIEEIWQPRYHDRIIRDEEEYIRISDYIVTNPKNWRKDKYHG